MSQPAIIKVKIRTGTSAEWLDANPILLEGEFGFISDDLQVIIGDGTNSYLTLIDSFHRDNQLATIQYVETAIGGFYTALGNEATARANADNDLQDLIDAIELDITNIEGSVSTLQSDVSTIQGLLALLDLTLTAKGQILVLDDVEGKYVPLQVGTNGQVLTADDTNSLGVSWSNVPTESIALDDLTDVNAPLPTSGDVLSFDGVEWVNSAPSTPTPLGYYGMWQDGFTQTAPSSNVGVAMIFRTTDLSNGVSVVTDGTNLTRITFAHTGIYNLQFSSQFQNIGNALHDVTIWLRLNGNDVVGSAGFVSVPQRKSVSDYGHIIVGWNYLLNVVGGQYYELVWSTTNHTEVSMQYYPAGNPPPSTASTIVTITQQSGIMAGTGMTALNGLSGAVQTFLSNSSGTDFNIASTGTTHTFNLPTASATNRGALSTTDWSTFNGKVTSPWSFRLSGRWYTPSTNALAIGSLGNLANSIRFSPVIIERDITITQLGISVVTIAGAGTTCRVGIYSNNPATNQPLNRLVDSGTIALDGTTGQRIVTGLSVTLTKGLYWFAYFSNASTGTIASIANLNLPDVLGITGTLNNGLITGYLQSLTYTNLPATASGFSSISSGASSYCVFYYY
jgi:hypothetical protein